mmetsp:Transcript_8328/g.10920  ORF Transcript_8328/g.10920 Transcript_8328/m.10920 type:complete len:350 (+) Transcript_8328:103-1152(+)|eukprot:CAMPEP_0198145754 /NCGR_PEP_ID=MMETSP1443-20131203/25159_1 /TAXON_ID=186043 /ORGANISM="Entomoneis sp., Strain CCMP2396" /LENGTH=349 /DNA_ID=CAMNT_0043809477 /DNA_START=16 /DNA_END=1065 /DNA_ORIENTATION=-
MRFKAKLAPEQISLFYSLVTSISGLSSSGGGGGGAGFGGGGGGGGDSSSFLRNGCMLFLDQESMRLSIRGKGTSECTGIACFVELKSQGGIFMEHRIESIAEKNGILMELDILQLRMALQSIQQEKYQSSKNNKKRNHQSMTSTDQSYSQFQQRVAILKLAKRNNTPCLCLEAGGVGGIEIQHAIPVRIARASDVKHHLPPAVPLPNVQLELSSTDRTPLRTIMERLRSISPTILVTGNPTGQLILEISPDSDMAVGCSIRTVLDGLTPRMEACNPETSRGGACTVKVDSNKIAMCLQWQQQTALVSTAFLCLVENEALVLHAMLNPSDVGFFTYYIPVHFLEDSAGDD